MTIWQFNHKVGNIYRLLLLIYLLPRYKSVKKNCLKLNRLNRYGFFWQKAKPWFTNLIFTKNLICIRRISRRPFVRDCQFYKIIITKVECKNMHFVGVCVIDYSFHLELYIFSWQLLNWNNVLKSLVLCEPLVSRSHI